jgi:hypothetical protein
MKATKENVAFTIFFSSFSVWVGLLVATVILTNSLIFSNAWMSTAFLASGGVACVSCGVVGLSFLGISLNLKGKQALKQEKVNDVIFEKPNQLTPKVRKRKRVKVAKASNLEISAVNETIIEEPPQLTLKVQKRKKSKAIKAPNLEVSVLGLLEEKELKQKT